jgi:hypothetical protein
VARLRLCRRDLRVGSDDNGVGDGDDLVDRQLCARGVLTDGLRAARLIDAPYGLQMLGDGLGAAIEAGQLERADPVALAYRILALLHEAVTMNLAAPEPLAERARTGQAVGTIIAGLRKS